MLLFNNIRLCHSLLLFVIIILRMYRHIQYEKSKIHVRSECQYET